MVVKLSNLVDEARDGSAIKSVCLNWWRKSEDTKADQKNLLDPHSI
jgi:hypothetical protein